MGKLFRAVNSQALLSAAIFLITWIVYLPTAGHEFIWDDRFFVEENSYLFNWRFLPKIFLSSIGEGATGAGSGIYRPLQSFTHFLDVQFFGLNAQAHHFTNIFLFALAGVALFLLLCDLLSANGRRFDWAAFFALSLWLFHPLQCEIVGYISGRGDILVFLFSGLAALAWPRKKITSVAFCLLSLLSKESGVLTPLLVIACDYVREPNLRWRERAKSYACLVAPAVIYVMARMIAWSAPTIWYPQDPGSLLKAHFSYRVFTYLSTIAKALFLIFRPNDLHHAREWPIFSTAGNLPVLLGGALVAILISTAALAWKRFPLLAVGAAWFLLASLPTSNLFVIGHAILFDHWFVLPALGICFAVALLFRQLEARFSLLASGVPFCVALGLLLPTTFSLGASWRSAEAQYLHILKFEPNSPAILNNLGNLYDSQGRILEALAVYKKSLEGGETGAARANFGRDLMRIGKMQEAELHLKRAAEMNPPIYQAMSSLGLLYLTQKKCSEAISYFEKSLAVFPSLEAKEGLAKAKECKK